MFARQVDTGLVSEVRGLVNDPVTGLAGRDPEAALAGIAETIPLVGEVKDRYLAQAKGPRQRALLEPLIDRRLDRAGGNDAAVRTGLSDLYGGAFDAPIGQDPKRAAIQPERQAAAVVLAASSSGRGKCQHDLADGAMPICPAFSSELYSAAIDWVAGLL